LRFGQFQVDHLQAPTRGVQSHIVNPPWAGRKSENLAARSIFINQDIPAIQTIRDLREFQVGVMAGDACIDRLRQEGVDDLRSYPSYRELIAGALAHNIEIFCLDEYPAHYYLAQANARKDFRKAFLLYTGQFHRAVRKGNTDKLALVERGAALIGAVEDQALREKWMPPAAPDYGPLLRGLKLGLIALTLLAGILFIWLRSLRLAVRRQTAVLEVTQLALKERIKEQECLHAVFRASESLDKPLGDVVRDIARALSTGWQFPEVAVARVAIDGECHATGDLRRVVATLNAPVMVGGIRRGDVTVGYTASRPGAAEGPFLGEERLLIDAIADRLAGILQGRDLARSAARREEIFHAIVDQAADSIAVVDPETAHFIEFNDAACRNLGYTREEFAALRIGDIEAGDTEEQVRQTLELLATKGGGVIERRHRHKDGSLRDVRISLRFLERDGRQLMAAIWSDITERKQAEAALIKARQVAEAASQAKTQFLAHMSHELRTPLNAILGFAQLLEHEALTEDQRDMVGTMREAGGNLLHIIDDILDLSKIEAGELLIKRAPFSLDPLLDRVERLMRNLAQPKGLGFVVHRMSQPPGILKGDIHRIEQVLVNLIGNAIKFTEQGEVSLTVTAAPATEGVLRLRFVIRDTGIGMAPDVLGNLFQSFKQGDASITRRFGGTGLGLAISKQLVEQMGGEIGADSLPGQGSTFWFELPVESEPADATLVSSTETAAPVPLALAGLRILAVDDNAINLRMIERALTNLGATVSLAGDGEAALRHLRAGPDDCDVVLMDIQMPVMDGLAATREIRRDPRLAALPVIALTAGVLPEEREAARAAGMDDFLTKPLNLADLTAILPRFKQPAPMKP